MQKGKKLPLTQKKILLTKNLNSTFSFLFKNLIYSFWKSPRIKKFLLKRNVQKEKKNITCTKMVTSKKNRMLQKRKKNSTQTLHNIFLYGLFKIILCKYQLQHLKKGKISFLIFFPCPKIIMHKNLNIICLFFLFCNKI